MNVRQLFVILGATLGLGLVHAFLNRSSTRDNQMAAGFTFPVEMNDREWRDSLTPEQYRVLREHGTERPFTSLLNGERRQGIFLCAACNQKLFSSDTKYDSGTGWPSFYKPIDGAVGTTVDRSWLMVRIEVHCTRCGGHLGHVFPDGPAPTGERYCINGVAMKFEPKQTR